MIVVIGLPAYAGSAAGEQAAPPNRHRKKYWLFVKRKTAKAL